MPRRVIGDFAISAGGLLILVFAIAAFDYRVREHVASASDVAGLGHQVSSLAILVAMVAVQFTREQMVEHAHLAVLTIAATVLVVFLLRL
jgi:hypothetical protein